LSVPILVAFKSNQNSATSAMKVAKVNGSSFWGSN